MIESTAGSATDHTKKMENIRASFRSPASTICPQGRLNFVHLCDKTLRGLTPYKI
jgi:hypothetical protein